jgi:hypothetical protein
VIVYRWISPGTTSKQESEIMEIPSLSTQVSASQAYAAQRQDQRKPDQSEEITRKEAEDAATQSGDRVTLSRESRAIAVQEAEQTQRQDEVERTNDSRAQENEQQVEARLRTANSPRSITQALEAYGRTSLV